MGWKTAIKPKTLQISNALLFNAFNTAKRNFGDKNGAANEEFHQKQIYLYKNVDTPISLCLISLQSSPQITEAFV